MIFTGGSESVKYFYILQYLYSFLFESDDIDSNSCELRTLFIAKVKSGQVVIIYPEDFAGGSH